MIWRDSRSRVVRWAGVGTGKTYKVEVEREYSVINENGGD